LSAKTFAEKLIVSRAAYAMYEESEISGTINLDTLANAAEAMDFVFLIRLKNKFFIEGRH
jgi:transcriptional regulator with XRE-family HTH domain